MEDYIIVVAALGEGGEVVAGLKTACQCDVAGGKG